MLHVHLEVILHVPADCGEVMHHLHAERLELGGVTDTAELQQLRGVEGASAQDHLGRVNGVRSPPTAWRSQGVLHAGGSGAVEQHPVH